MKAVVGVDPGASGGIAVVSKDGVKAIKMPSTDTDILKAMQSIAADYDCVAFLEEVQAMPSDGRTSAFVFGVNYGALRMALVAAKIPHHLVRPNVWCGRMGLKRKKDESITKWKNRHKAMAQRLYPTVTITHAVADSLLIAEYGRSLLSMGASY